MSQTDTADLAEVGFRLACGRQSDGDNCAQVFNDLSDDVSIYIHVVLDVSVTLLEIASDE